MTTLLMNIPGTTLVIKREDLLSCNVTAKVFNRFSIEPPNTSDSEFVLMQHDDLVLSVKAAYHTIIEASAEAENTDAIDKIIEVEVVIEPLSFRESEIPLKESTQFLALSEEWQDWVINRKGKFYKKNLQLVETLLDLQSELIAAQRESESAIEDLDPELGVKPVLHKDLLSKIKALEAAIEADKVKHAKRIPEMEEQLFENGKEVLVYNTENAYDVIKYLLDGGMISENDADSIGSGISQWVKTVSDIMNGLADPEYLYNRSLVMNSVKFGALGKEVTEDLIAKQGNDSNESE